MANEGNIVCGLDPQPDCNGQIETRPKVPVSLNDYPAFRGSPYQIADGVALVKDWNSVPTEICAGVFVKLYDVTGNIEVVNLPPNTTGFADVTYLKDQRYVVRANGVGFADNGSDNGKTYALTTETGTAGTDGLSGVSVSTVSMDTTQEDPSANTFLASFKVLKPRNLGDADGTLVEGTINPACHQAW